MARTFNKLPRRDFLCKVVSGMAMAATGKASAMPQYPLYRAAGSHRELGRQHGEQGGEKIKEHVAKIARTGGFGGEELRRRALAFRPLFEKYCPHLLEEIEGLAEGARISLAEALAVNIRDPLSLAPAGCTSLAVGRAGTAQHQIIAGKNCDMESYVVPLGYILHLKPVNKPEVLMWTFGGMIGYHGMNSAGVAEFDNALFGRGPAGRWALPQYPLKRLMLECNHVDQIAQLFRTIPVAMNTNYIVCDGHGNIMDIEATTAGPAVFRDHGQGFLAHTNHYLDPRFPDRRDFPDDWKDSFPRFERINSLIKNKFGSIRVDDGKKFLSDHAGYPSSICRHSANSTTVASLLAEPAERRMHVSHGNPCTEAYVTYSF